MVGAAHIAAFLLNLGETSESALRRRASFVRGHSLGDVFGHLLRQVKREFLVEFPFHLAAPHERAPTQPQYVITAPQVHWDASGAMRITSPTAFDMRSHCSNSFSSCVRPALVRV